MRSLVLVAALIAITCSVASADFSVVDPSNCEVPSHLIVVGSNGSYGDIAGTFSVVVRDFNHRTMNCMVEVWFADCPYVRLCTNQLSSGLTMSCASRVMSRMSDAGGAANFRVIGDASPAGCPSDPPGRVSVYACGVLIGTATVSVLDIDGEPGLSGNDRSGWRASSAIPPPRAWTTTGTVRSAAATCRCGSPSSTAAAPPWAAPWAPARSRRAWKPLRMGGVPRLTPG